MPRTSTDPVRRAPAGRWARLLGWCAGVPLAAYRYLAAPPGRLHEKHVASAGDVAPGSGCTAHRLFSLRVTRPRISAGQLLSIIAVDPNVVSPWEVLRWDFAGPPGRGLQEGDEVLVRMAGPWNGPLTVVSRTRERLRLRSGPGNVLHGELELRVHDHDGALRIEVELWERVDHRLLAFLHDRLGLTARMQTHTWASFLERARRISGGTAQGPVQVRTERRTRAR